MSATQDHDVGAQFHLDVEPERDVVRVCPSGEVDLVTADRVSAQVEDLVSVGFTRIVVDLRAVTFLDSTGIRLLLELQQSACADGWQLAVIEGPRDVQRVFEIAGVTSMLPFFEASAIASAGGVLQWR
jgi:anti-sigma B factor antagonist